MIFRQQSAGFLVALVAALVLAGCGSSGQSESAQSGNPDASEAHSLPSGWSSADLSAHFKAPAEPIDLISCASGPFCMIAAGPQSVAFEGGQFSGAQEIASGGEAYGAVQPIALSCASSHFCMAISQEYSYFTWNGSTWRAAGEVPGEVVSGGTGALSCGADGHCVAIGADGETGTASMLSFEGGRWSSSPIDDDGQLLTQVSCASAEYCQMLGNDGDVFTYDGKSWGPPVRVTVADDQEANDVMSSVSCASGPLCLGAGHLGGAVLVDRGNGFEQLPGAPELLDVAPEACGSLTFCLVTPLSSRRFESFDGRRFRSIAQPPGNPELEFLSCTEDGLCMASVAETDEILTFNK